MDVARRCLWAAALCAPLALASGGARAQEVLLQGPSGGAGGNGFADLQPGGVVVELHVRSGALIDGIGLVYQVAGRRLAGPWHGGQGGTLDRFVLEPGERVVTLAGRSGRFVDSLTIRTDRGRERTWGGPGGEQAFRYDAPSGGELTGLWGRSGALLDAVGPAFAAPGGALAAGRLDAFAAPRPPLAPGERGKADSAPSRDFPQAASPPGSAAWLAELSAALGRVVRDLAGSDASFRGYLYKERTACGADELCRLWFRQGAIAHVVGGG